MCIRDRLVRRLNRGAATFVRLKQLIHQLGVFTTGPLRLAHDIGIFTQEFEINHTEPSYLGHSNPCAREALLRGKAQ